MQTRQDRLSRPIRYPFIQPGEPVTQYAVDMEVAATAILRNLFHRYPWYFCRPTGNHPKQCWHRAQTSLIHHRLITPNGNFLTELGYSYIDTHQKDFTPHV